MKLLFITEDRFPPYRADVVELFARQLGGEFGITIDWYMQEGPEASSGPFCREWFGHKAYILPRINWGGIVGRLLNVIMAMIGDWLIIPLALKNKYQAIQVRDRFFTCIFAWIAAKMTGAQFFYWMSYPFPESRLYLARQKLTNKRLAFFLKGYTSSFLLYRFILPRADHIFVQSDQMLKDVQDRGVRADKMTAVPMGIISDQIIAVDNIKRLNTDTPILLYIGTLHRIRRLEFLLNVFKEVRNHYPKAKLLFVGEGEVPEDRSFLEQETRTLGLTNFVEFTGFVPMQEVWRYVEMADICFSPFYPIPMLLSTSPTKLIEYLAKGKNVVANQHPEQQRILTESGAGRCVPWEIEAFRKEVCRILDDPQSAREQAARGPDYVRHNRTYTILAASVFKIYQRFFPIELNNAKSTACH